MSRPVPIRRDRAAAPARRLIAGVLFLCLMTTAALAQAVASSDNEQIIDLGIALEVSEDALTAPAGPPTPAAPRERHVEIADESLLTLPEYSRTRETQEEVARTHDVLLPLQSEQPTLANVVRLTGEVQSEDFFVDLPEASSARELVLSYRIAINVLPEQSELHIRVNGTDLEPVTPTAFEGFEQLVLPSSLLIDGRNVITVTAFQAHRIFCGPEATFAVWTEINTNISGVTLAREELPVNPFGLRMALGAQVAVSGRLPVHLPDETSEGFFADLAPRLAGLRDGAPVQFDRVSPYAVLDGPAQMARITVLPGDGAPYAEVMRAADDALVLVLVEGIDGTMPDLDDVLPMPGAVPNIPALPPGTVTTLRDLDFTQTEAFNRYSEQEVTFGLPDDWLVLASQRAMLRLDYSFADGLPQSAIMLVKMNETTVALLPLDRDGGKTLPTLEIDFPARLLVPGANALTFVAIIPGDPPEMHCPPLTGPLLTIGAQSTMFVPPSPRMRMIGLDRPLLAMRPEQVRADADVPGNPEVAVGLMATVSAALSPVADTRVIPDASLTVAYGTKFGQLDLSDLGISRRDLNRLLPEGRGAPPTSAQQQVEDPAAAPPPGVVERIKTRYAKTVRWLHNLAVPDDGPLEPWLEDRTAEAVLFIPQDEKPEDLWLLVSPQVQPGRVAAILSQARLSPHGPKGRFSVLTADGDWESWHTTRTAPQLLEPLGIANFREVAGNYASWSPLYFCAVLLALVIGSTCLALIYIVTTRGNGKT